MQLSQKRKIFSDIFLQFLNLLSILKISNKKMTGLNKCLKSPVLEDLSTSNKGRGPKHCSVLNDSNFRVFIDPCSSNSGQKRLSSWYAKL